MKIEALNWDSEFFGLGVGRLELQADDELDAPEFLRLVDDRGFDLIYVIRQQHMLAGAVLSECALELMDVQLTMSQPFDRLEHASRPYVFRQKLSESELAQCYAIAEQTSVVSRFHREPLVGPEMTRALYRRWVDSALDGTLANGLLAIELEGKIMGIHLIRTDARQKAGHCSVIGVDAAYKRLNIGRQLWQQAFGYWANETDIQTCKVPFSLQNAESLNFHLKMGFSKVDQVRYTYHFRRGSR